jgi:hypothetical protein
VDGDDCCHEHTSFTNSVNAKDIGNPSLVPGDFSNDPSNNCPTSSFTEATESVASSSWFSKLAACEQGSVPCPTPANCCPDALPIPIQIQNVAFFRKVDNNPVAVFTGPIDMTSFTSNPSQLPGGSSYARNANRTVAQTLDPVYSRTQSVMYSLDTVERVFLGLTADDVNMVRMGMSGDDRIEGTGDDYTVNLQLLPDCSTADIRVKFVASLPSGASAVCDATIDQSYDQGSYVNRRHWTMVANPMTGSQLEIQVSAAIDWDYSVLVFQSGFETGDLSEWGP